MGDPGTNYRPKEEIEEWKKKKDPIDKLYARLLKEKIITEGENRKIEEDLNKELDEAVKFALGSSEISVGEAFRDTVYTGWPVNLKKI
jgi:pyruvate dehydrogenase E1 component alpha subunit